MIGQRIRKWRKQKGLKLIELARTIGISHGSLSDIETEKTDPSADTLFKFVGNTDINLAWLFTGKGPMESSQMLISEEGYTPVDDTIGKIILLLKDMDKNDRREILKHVEEKKLLKELLEERRKKEGL
ncbi:MAG TPA: XRE family transcriptional regulator [Nitrospirae bacterium]|nr:XRE family transcriptional regulator [Nitrospirota bacterium]HDK81043.1 XRE family transcriptional regulator [Nitrospirota bacterium]HDO25643.1 XRE family transcriptional regulator [Nitrospirota bacterium]